jgi:hypothetical protein
MGPLFCGGVGATVPVDDYFPMRAHIVRRFERMMASFH